MREVGKAFPTAVTHEQLPATIHAPLRKQRLPGTLQEECTHWESVQIFSRMKKDGKSIINIKLNQKKSFNFKVMFKLLY